MTGRVRDMIMDPMETGKLAEVIAEGAYYGMQTFDQSLFHLYKEGAISLDQALETASHPHDFKLLVASEGQRSTSVTHLYGDDEQSEEASEPEEPHRPGPVEAPPRPSHEPGAPAVSVSPPPATP
jgi:twitching motility protein PilT